MRARLISNVHGHRSAALDRAMRFSLFKPPQAKTEPRPVLFRLSGLTHGEENFTVKAGAQRLAARLDLIVAALDSSPRGVDLAGESECPLWVKSGHTSVLAAP
ncbi:MAG: alpha/beta hydrolase-fold protein [Rhodospirillales bacterium]|nr:alpha/beta hydrolase-fold protein [Rhodospirillales bacterium]MDP7215295.1 alpha/beta hydrolase-fold protein [Rhodospirillales bacterium]HJP53617.1 alpha/beta hydrolase-fold protein [Rhodospirillales bacterium]